MLLKRRHLLGQLGSSQEVKLNSIRAVLFYIYILLFSFVQPYACVSVCSIYIYTYIFTCSYLGACVCVCVCVCVCSLLFSF